MHAYHLQSLFIPDTSCFPKTGDICSPVHQVELCEALRSSVAALQREKQALCEEQRRHQALGASIEALIQEQLKTNEKEKYSIFIGREKPFLSKRIPAGRGVGGVSAEHLVVIFRRSGEDREPSAVSVQPPVEGRQVFAFPRERRVGDRGRR